ncbi:MAG: porin family protein [Prevotella sp.]|nr:porin family protein [Prevotella sp.]
MNDKWTQQFQDKLDGHGMSVPELAWDSIDSALAKKRRTSMRIVWGRRIAAAAVGLILIGGTGILFRGFDSATEMLQTAQTMDVNTKHETNGNSVKEILKVNLEARLANNQKRAKSHEMPIITNHQELLANNDNNDELSSMTGKNVGEKETSDVKDENPETVIYDRYKSGENAKNRGEYVKKRSEDTRRRKSDLGGELTAAVYMQNATTGNGSNGIAGGVSSSPVMSKPYGAVSEEFRAGSLDFLAESNPRTVTYDHDHPIKVGIGVKYSINDRWSVLSGLTYSYLRSDFDYSEGKNSGSGVQKLHYVGIPLAASYNLLSGKNLKLYLTAGGEMQKLVSGKVSVGVMNGAEENKAQDVREGGMQWSLNAAAGVEYNFMRNAGIYVEPGVTHYIDNNSNIDNYYKHKPTNFSLNLGLRFTFK